MNRKALLSVLLMSGVFVIPSTAFTQYERSYDRENGWYDRGSDNYRGAGLLQGRWYMNGDQNKPTEISFEGRRLKATNENGQTSRLELGSGGRIRASDWQDIRGTIKGNRIDWDNGTTWTRRPSDRIGGWYNRWSDRDARQLQGRWYMNGDPAKPTEINVEGRRFEAKNENGHTSRLDVDRGGNLIALDWQGVRGSVRGDRIEWSNGTKWTRRPSERFGKR